MITYIRGACGHVIPRDRYTALGNGARLTCATCNQQTVVALLTSAEHTALYQARELLAIIIRPGMIHELDAPDEQCYFCHQPEWEGHKDDCPWGRAEDLVRGRPIATLEAIPARELLRKFAEFVPVTQDVTEASPSCFYCEASPADKDRPWDVEHELYCPWRQAVELLGVRP